MRILMLSWEYPPRTVGGIAPHLYDLSQALARCGHQVHVVTTDEVDGTFTQMDGPVAVTRTPLPPNRISIVEWVDVLNARMAQAARSVLRDWLTTDEPVVLHAHDWLAEPSAVVLKHEFGLPLVATIHATEYGRNGGIREPLQREIASREWRLTYEAWRVICCSEFMRHEVHTALDVPGDKIDVAPNGVDTDPFTFPFPTDAQARFRAQYAPDNAPLFFFVGRMVPEKGAHLLIDAMRYVRVEFPDARAVIAGGGSREHLVHLARWLGLRDHVTFTGFTSDATKRRLQRVATAAVAPSLYEPFGIVALEAMAAGTPVVVSDAGGLKEIVDHEVTGLTAYAGDSLSLANQLLRIAHAPEWAQGLAERAFQKVQTVYSWDRIASQTADVYTRVWSESRMCHAAR